MQVHVRRLNWLTHSASCKAYLVAFLVSCWAERAPALMSWLGLAFTALLMPVNLSEWN